MLYVPEVHRLVLADRSAGMEVYDCSTKQLLHARSDWKGHRVSSLKKYRDGKVLIATEGIGVYCLNMDNYQISSFLNADSEKGGSIRRNRISDLFVDEHQRIWVADFPDGVSMVDGLDLEEHGWYKHVS